MDSYMTSVFGTTYVVYLLLLVLHNVLTHMYMINNPCGAKRKRAELWLSYGERVTNIFLSFLYALVPVSQ